MILDELEFHAKTNIMAKLSIRVQFSNIIPKKCQHCNKCLQTQGNIDNGLIMINMILEDIYVTYNRVRSCGYEEVVLGGR